MASESEAWWRFRYSQYSIKDLQKLPVYHRFLQLHYPYERTNSQRSERYTVSEAVDEFEWKEEGRWERFAHRKEEQQYQYTCRFQDQKSAVTVESWKAEDKDWGTVTKHFEGWTLVEGWKVQPTERTYERFVEEQGIKRGMKCGVKEDGERWVEEIWSQEGENTVKRSWELPTSSGGESHSSQGDYEWGEQWTSDSAGSSQKCWHQEGCHTWGSAQGRHGRDETWEHQWDCETSCKFDQKVVYRAGKAQGYRYRSKGQDWCKEEWEGLEPEPHTLHFAGRISCLLEREYAGALAANRNLKLLLLQTQGKSDQIADIERKLANMRISPSSEVPLLLSQLEELRTLQDQQESLKPSLWSPPSAPFLALKATATESLATLRTLHCVHEAEMEQIAGEIQQAEDLGQVETWQDLLHSLEVLKQKYISSLQKQALETESESISAFPASNMSKMMKDLQDLVTTQHFLAVALSTAVGDEEKAANIEGLWRVSEAISNEFKTGPGEECFFRLLSTGKALGRIGLELVEELGQGAGVAEEAAERIRAEVLPQLEQLTRDLNVVNGEIAGEETLKTEAMSLTTGINSVQKRLKTARGLANRLKPAAKDTEQLVPHSPPLNKADLGASEEAVASQAMQLLEPAQEELNDLVQSLVERNSVLETQLGNLQKETSSGFHDYRQTHKVAFLYRSIQGLRAYFPLLKAMLIKANRLVTSEEILTEVWTELQYILADMNDVMKAMAEGQSDWAGKVVALETQGLKLTSTDNPSSSDLLQALRLLRTTQATLRELGDQSSLRTGLETLKSTLTATQRDAEELVAGSSELQGELADLEPSVVAFIDESRAWPREGHFAMGLNLLRNYIQYFTSTTGKAAKPAVSRLKSAVKEWNLEVVEKLDRELAANLQRKCEEIARLADEYSKSQQPNINAFLQTLEEYFLLLRALPIRQTAKEEKGVMDAMKELEALQVEMASQVQQLSSQDPSLMPQATALTVQFNLNLAACKKNPNNSHLIKAASTLRSHLPLLLVSTRPQSMPENAILAPQEVLQTLQEVLRDLDTLGTELTDGESVPQLQALKEASVRVLQKSAGTASVLEALGVMKAYAIPLRSQAKKAGSRRTLKVLEQALDDAHSVAEDLASEHSGIRREVLGLREKATSVLKEYQKEPKYPHLRKGLVALAAYYPFFCRHDWTSGLSALRPMLEEIHSIGLDLSDGNEIARNQLVTLRHDALIPIQAQISTERSLFPTAIRGLRSYFPVLKDLISSTLRNSNLQVADEAMRGLSQAATELNSLGRLLGGKEALSRSRLRTLAESAAVPFREYGKQPQIKYLPRAITALLPYFPAFRDFLRSRISPKSPSVDSKITENDITSLRTIWETAKSHAEEIRGLAQALAEDDSSYLPRLQSLAKGVFRPFSAGPSLANLHTALTALRGYHPELLQLSRRAGLKTAMDLLRTHIEETHKEAVCDTITESDSEEMLGKLRSEALAPFHGFSKEPRTEHLQQAITAFRRYHPFFRHFARKITLKLLEPLATDLHTLSRELASESREKEQLASLRKAAKAPFNEKEPKEVHLRQAVAALQAYAPFLRALFKAKSGVPLSAIEQAMKALELHQSDITDLATSLLGAESFDPRLTALHGSVSVPFREFQQSPDFSHLPRAITALRSYYPLLKSLLNSIHEQSSQASAASLEAALAALEPATGELAELSRDLTIDDDSLDAQLRALREAAEAPFKANRSTPQSSENLLKAIKAVRDYHSAMKDWIRKGGFRWVVELIERAVADTHKEAVELASNDQALASELQQLESDSQAPFREFRVRPRRGQAVQGMQALRAYHPFFRQYSWRFALKHLEAVLADLQQLAEECSGDQSLPALRRQALRPFTEHRETPKLVHIQQAIAAVSAYFPLFRGLRSGSSPDFASTEVKGPHFSVTEAMEQLEPALSELESLVQILAPAATYQPRLTSLREEGLQPFVEYRKSPQYSLLTRAIGAIRAYHPLLLELLKKAKSSYEDTDQGSDEIMKELESIAGDLSKLAEELNDGDPELDSILTLLRDSTEAQFRENRRVPKRGNVLKAAKTLRAYRSLLLDLGKKVGLQAALDLLKPVLLETHQEAIEHVTGAEQEYLPELAQLEKDGKMPYKEPRRVSRRLCFLQGLKALRAYHPFFRKYWWRSTLALLEPTLPEFDRILVSCHPACEPKLTLLREKSSKLFRRYRSNYNPSLLPLSIELLRTYHRVLHSTQQVTPETETISLPTEVAILEASDAQVEQAETLLGAERQEAVSSNVLIETLSKANVASERPLTYLNIFKFFEELMDKKFEVDSQDLQAGRKPRVMTEFLMEHLNRQFGIKSLAMRFLGQFIPGLQILYNENLPYAVLFARLLQVWHPEPIPFQLALYLVRIRMEFHKLMEKYTREREIQRKRQKGKKLETTHGRAAYDQAATGGEAFTTEVISLVYDLFENDEKNGELALQLLRPEGCSLADYVTFKLCHKMAKLGMSAEAVFKLIDEDGGGSISEAEFVSGLKSTLELWITEADIKEVYQELAKGGELTLQDFTERCNFSWFLKVEKSEEYTNTKCHFLSVLVTLFNRRQRDVTAQLIALYDSKQETPLSKETFTVLLRSLDADIPQERVDTIWMCGCEEGQSGEGLTETAFVRCMLKYPTGPFSKTTFCRV